MTFAALECAEEFAASELIHRKKISAAVHRGLEPTKYVYLSKVRSLTHRLYSPVHPGLKCWASVGRVALRSLWSQQQSDCYWHWAASRTAAYGACSLKFCSGCACIQQTAFPLDFGWCSAPTWSILCGLCSRSKEPLWLDRNRSVTAESQPPQT